MTMTFYVAILWIMNTSRCRSVKMRKLRNPGVLCIFNTVLTGQDRTGEYTTERQKIRQKQDVLSRISGWVYLHRMYLK